jgi:hypothetical protein
MVYCQLKSAYPLCFSCEQANRSGDIIRLLGRFRRVDDTGERFTCLYRLLQPLRWGNVNRRFNIDLGVEGRRCHTVEELEHRTIGFATDSGYSLVSARLDRDNFFQNLR